LGCPEEDEEVKSDDGVDPNHWICGSLLDIPDDKNASDYIEEKDNNGSCWGLSDEAIAEGCFAQYKAIQEFEALLVPLFPQFHVTRLPEAVFGSCVSPLTANAPRHGDQHFEYHIDGDPFLTPPSPWTDVYGRYPNHIKGKPHFMSCII
jgi:hypothetical protein